MTEVMIAGSFLNTTSFICGAQLSAQRPANLETATGDWL